MSFLQQLKNQSVLLLGLGVTGNSCARFLAEQDIDFIANDSRKNVVEQSDLASLKQCQNLILGQWSHEAIAEADTILLSPGIDVNAEKLSTVFKPNQTIIGDVELFCRISDTPILAVTGSNGKSTVVSMLTHVAKALGFKAEMAGNIGVPILSYYQQELDFLILELSSFQLETITSMKAKAACVLNVSDDHLDRHQTMTKYSALKHSIYDLADIAVVNMDVAANIEPISNPCKLRFSSENEQAEFRYIEEGGSSYIAYNDVKLAEVSSLPLAGKHNALNCLAVLAMGQACEWPLETMIEAIMTYKGLPHRCQIIPTHDDIYWVNDSKATNIGATIAAIEGLNSAMNRLILIAGGDGKGADFSQLNSVLNSDVALLIAFGKDGGQLASLVEHSIVVSSLEEAVEVARLNAKSGDTVLLSPACASLDMFTNYIERGNCFEALVRNEGSICN